MGLYRRKEQTCVHSTNLDELLNSFITYFRISKYWTFGLQNLFVRGRAWSCVVVRGRAWSCVVVRGRAWSCVVVRGRAWSCVGVRAWSCVVVRGSA